MSNWNTRCRLWDRGRPNAGSYRPRREGKSSYGIGERRTQWPKESAQELYRIMSFENCHCDSLVAQMQAELKHYRTMHVAGGRETVGEWVGRLPQLRAAPLLAFERWGTSRPGSWGARSARAAGSPLPAVMQPQQSSL